MSSREEREPLRQRFPLDLMTHEKSNTKAKDELVENSSSISIDRNHSLKCENKLRKKNGAWRKELYVDFKVIYSPLNVVFDIHSYTRLQRLCFLTFALIMCSIMIICQESPFGFIRSILSVCRTFLCQTLLPFSDRFSNGFPLPVFSFFSQEKCT